MWVGDCLRKLKGFPEEVRDEIGYALYLAQCGDQHPSAKRMKGIHAVEIVADHDGEAYRRIYYRPVSGLYLCPALFSKEVEAGKQNARARVGNDPQTIERS